MNEVLLKAKLDKLSRRFKGRELPESVLELLDHVEQAVMELGGAIPLRSETVALCLAFGLALEQAADGEASEVSEVPVKRRPGWPRKNPAAELGMVTSA